MTVADLSRKAALENMVRLDEGDLLERPGSEPETPAEEFEGRGGYYCRVGSSATERSIRAPI